MVWPIKRLSAFFLTFVMVSMLLCGSVASEMDCAGLGHWSATEPPINLLVGNNLIAAQAALTKAEELGFMTQLLTTTMQGEARLIGEEMSDRLKHLAEMGSKRPSVWVAGGETTVTLRGDGRGGRNQELALAAVPGLAGLEHAALITLATDGGDGPTDAAGAVVTGDTFSRAIRAGLDPQAALERNDSHTFFSQLGDCLTPGPTRTNVNDLLFLFLFGPPGS